MDTTVWTDSTLVQTLLHILLHNYSFVVVWCLCICIVECSSLGCCPSICTLYQDKFLVHANVLVILISFSPVYIWPKLNLPSCGSRPSKARLGFREEIAVLEFLMNILLNLLSFEKMINTLSQKWPQIDFKFQKTKGRERGDVGSFEGTHTWLRSEMWEKISEKDQDSLFFIGFGWTVTRRLIQTLIAVYFSVQVLMRSEKVQAVVMTSDMSVWLLQLFSHSSSVLQPFLAFLSFRLAFVLFPSLSSLFFYLFSILCFVSVSLHSSSCRVIISAIILSWADKTYHWSSWNSRGPGGPSQSSEC